jgi:hypothetical protein
MMASHELPQSVCSCGHLLDGATGMAHNDPPNPGDVSLCFYCGRLNIFNDDLTLRQATVAEEASITTSPQGLLIMAMRRKIRENGHQP